jgi:hypothetical protein
MTVRAQYFFDGRTDRLAQLPGSRLVSGMPALTLTSDPVVFEVVRPLDLTIRVKRPLRVRSSTRPDNDVEPVHGEDVVEVALVNRSTEPVEFRGWIGPDGRGLAGVEWDQAVVSYHRLYMNWENSTGRVLRPGESMPLDCSSELLKGSVRRWSRHRGGSIRLRAFFWASINGVNVTIRSEWADAPVEP